MNDYPLLNLFWTMLWFFLFVAWIYLLIVVVTDIFRSDDLSGWGKALWVLFVVIVPWLGILVYLIARGDKMSARAASDYQRRDEEMRAYVRDAAGTSGPEHCRRADQARGAARFGHDHRGRVRAAESQTPRLRHTARSTLSGGLGHTARMTVLLMIGTRKGLWIARGNDDRRGWDLGDPHFLMQEIPACAIDTRGGTTRLLVGARSEHWGPSVFHSDDYGSGTSPTVERSGSRPKRTLR